MSWVPHKRALCCNVYVADYCTRLKSSGQCEVAKMNEHLLFCV